MYRRKFSAVAAGALVMGVLSVPMVSSTAQAATATGATFSCTVSGAFSKTYDWQSDVTVTAARVAGDANVTLTAKVNDLTGFNIPLDIPGMKNVGSMSVAVGAATTNLTGTKVADFSESGPVASPVMSGSIAASGATIDVGVTKLDFVATGLGMDVPVNCTPKSPTTVTGVEVVTSTPAPNPNPPVVVTKVASKVSATAKVKKRVATVTAKVTGSKGLGGGKVTITVKKGKKTVKKGAVTLKKGAATLKTKKLAKGTYTVTVSYPGSSAYNTGSAKKTFKVK